jgi:hypothetical protein
MILSKWKHHPFRNACITFISQFRRTAFRAAATLCATLILLTGPVKFASAQDIFGRIGGTITDSSGAVVASAKVTITNEATLISRVVTADKSGYFAADEITAGTYSVTAEQTGFKTTTKTGNVLSAGGRLTVDLTLVVGEITERVTVTANGDTVNTTSGEISTTITQDQVLDMALNQRHYESLVGLVPGAALQGSGTNPAALTANYNNSVAVINGQRLDGQNWSVDGGFNLDSGSNNSVFNQVGVDFIQEVDVQASNYDAEFGRSASSTVNVVTKSGGEQYHGGGFEFVQNNIFNAENAGTKLTNPTAKGYSAVPPFHFNDFGWDLGGPIPYIQKKGKLFFFAGQEWKKFRGVYPGLTAASVQETFPTAAEAAGNFTDVLNGGSGIVLKTPAVIPASCGGVLYTSSNVINPSCITGDGAAIASIYEQAAKLSVAGALPTSIAANNTTFNLANPLNLREDIIRVDEHANDKHSFYFRYIHDNVDIYNPYSTFGAGGAVPVDPDLRDRPGYNYQIGWTYMISPTLINSVKFNADWHKQRTPLQGTAWMRSNYGFQFIPPLGNPSTFPDGLPTISFTAVANVPTSAPAGVNGPAPNFLASPTTDINPSDNVVWQKNNHTIKFGAEFARNRKTQNSRTNYDGTINFSTNAGATTGSNSTGDPFADALLGNFNSLGQSSAVTVGQFRFNDVESYLQDTWKVTRKLSLVLGVRYTYSTPTYAQGNNMTNFDPYTFNPGLDPTFTGGLATSSINPASPGLCSGPLLNVIGTPVLTIECNGLQRPGGVPFDQLGKVPVTYEDPQLLASIPGTAARGFYKPENLWAPRVGFSYSPFRDNKTVVRGGFGIFYDHPEGNVLGNGINSQGYVPWAQSASISGTNASLAQFDNAPGAGTVAAPSTLSLSGVDPNLVVARSYQYSLGVQRELPQGILVQAAYVGNLGRHILRTPSFNNASWTDQAYIPVSPNPNNLACPTGINAAAFQCSVAGFAPVGLSKDQIRPYLGYSSISMALSDVDSNYNALQLSLTKRTGILTATASYTYSKAMGDGGGAGDAYNENPEPECPFTCLVSTAANPVQVNGGTTAVAGGTQTGGVIKTWKQYEYGKLSFDATNIFAATFTVESPWGRNMTGVEGGLVKGWSLSALTHYQSGAPLTATASQALGLNGANVARRANIVSGQSLAFTGTCANPHAICWVNPNAFSLESTLGAGDAPINDIIGPNFYQWDLSLRKTFTLPWREGMRLQFQADAFNAFNRANWNNPNVSNAGATSFGQITGSLPARVLQFGGKFNF